MATFPDLVNVPGPLLVGFSGGLDSSVLLHWLHRCAQAAAQPVRAVHVHHGLQAQADAWVQHCQQQCAVLGVPLRIHRVQVNAQSGLGPEGAARQARREAFSAELERDETLVLAQHQDDQAETFLLRALRGAGVDGLAAMAAETTLEGRRLWRPLLGVPRRALQTYAEAHGLAWVEDPSNACDDADRNFLRLRVLPLLRQRWPHAAAALATSAAHAGQLRTLLEDEDAALLQHVQVTPNVLSLDLLRQVSRERRARLVRAWSLRQCGSTPPGRVLTQLEEEVLGAASDRAAQVRWGTQVIRQWREHLYLLPAELPVLPAGWEQHWDGRAPLALPDGGELRLLGAAAFAAPLQVRGRRGGERIQLPGRTHLHAVKDCLQREHLAPWRRAQLPLLYDGDTLLAAADVVIGAGLQPWLDAQGARLRWRPGGW